jgi:CBS domain-containing protein
MAAIADVMSLRVVTVKPEESVGLAIARMLEENVGSVAVCEGSRLVGIFTERDVLRLAGENSELQELKIGDVMTRAVLTVSPDDDVLGAAMVMAERRIRHLPVVQDATSAAASSSSSGAIATRAPGRRPASCCGAPEAATIASSEGA